LGPIIQIVAAVQAMEAIKWLADRREAMNPNLQVFSIWDNRWQQIKVSRATMSAHCPTCLGQEYPWLTGQRGSQTQVLCGRNSVQIRPAEDRELDLAKFAANWQTLGKVTHNEFLVKLQLPELEITLFPDARAIIYGTDEVAMAKSIYSRYVGN
jgi:adenylyltransferase/sulfurtransferase